MVILPYFGPMAFQFPLNLTSTNTKVENMLKANDIWKKTRKACKTGVLHVTFTELPLSSDSAFCFYFLCY